MIVIIPHPTEELVLIQTQKKLIAQVFEKGKIIYAHAPLWIPTNFETVEQAKKEIKSVTVLAPAYDENKEDLICPVRITINNGKVLESRLDFIHGGRNDAAIQFNESTFPLSLKIFRLGICTSPKPGVYELSSSVWKKIK